MRLPHIAQPLHDTVGRSPALGYGGVASAQHCRVRSFFAPTDTQNEACPARGALGRWLVESESPRNHTPAQAPARFQMCLVLAPKKREKNNIIRACMHLETPHYSSQSTHTHTHDDDTTTPLRLVGAWYDPRPDSPADARAGASQPARPHAYIRMPAARPPRVDYLLSACVDRCRSHGHIQTMTSGPD